ncbi:hypothetical protein DFH07DRAFT_950883 [Mycena maculata]|uniref:Uncharacterized protein n=1 Tax=Mycena maculata TaxID=230809 RepID=A0AAD7K8B2_9AGAR|nr:hypothetical protein DFH07DRAFT_950883 [Mycena maculata]
MSAYPSVPAASSSASNDSAHAAAALQFFNALSVLSQAPMQTERSALIGQATESAAADMLVDSPPQVATTRFQTRGPWIAGNLYVVVPSGPLLPLAKDPVPEGEDAPLWYCITKGSYIGVTLSNDLVIAAVTGVSSSRMKSYKTQALALTAFNEAQSYGLLIVISS